jgi:DNA polymerase III sliding clamp (beta) subunit (PCNA family)
MKISREDVLSALNQLKPALPASSSIPALQHLWANGKTVSAYDGNLGIRADLKLEFQGGIPGAPFLGLLGSTSVEAVKLENSKGALNVSLGRARAKLPMLPIEDDPWDFPTKLSVNTWQITIDEMLIKALINVLQVKIAKPVRAEHYGISFYPTKNGCYLYATDEICLARGFSKCKVPNDEPMVLPRAFLNEVVNLCVPGDAIYILKDCLMAKGKGLQICSTLLVVEDLVDLNSEIEPHLKGASPTPIPEGLEDALRRSMILARGEAPLVRLTAEEGTLTVYASHPAGEFTESLECGEALVGEVIVQANMLIKLLKNVDTIAMSERDSIVLRGPGSLAYVLSGAGA